jgi:hypothetical protein
VPQVVETEVLDPGTLFRLVPRRRALVDALTGEGETPAPVLTARRLERRQGVRIERNTAALEVPGSLRGEFWAMLKICSALRDNIKALLSANLASWAAGHARGDK